MQRLSVASSPLTTRLGLIALLGAVPLSSCVCGDPYVIKVAPQIFVDVCADPQRVVQNKNIGGYQECLLDFGNADISVRTERFFTITNPSNLDLKLESIELVGDPAFEFIE